MHIDDYLFDGNDHDLNDIEHSGLSSFIPDNVTDNYQDDEDFLNEVMDEYHHQTDHFTFRGRDTLPPNANSDGYIPSGKQELTTTISDIDKTFKLYTKCGHKYVLYNGAYYQIDGSGTVTIGGVKYDKIG